MRGKSVDKRREGQRQEAERDQTQGGRVSRQQESSIVMYNFGVGPHFAYVSASARAPK